MADQLDTSPDLNGRHTFSRVNPLIGLTYMLARGMTAYAVYSEANRAPTPLELGCANPCGRACWKAFWCPTRRLRRLYREPVKSVCAATRRSAPAASSGNFGLFRTDSSNDIISVASPIPGRGVFQNVEGTRRQGVEASAQVKSGPWLAYAAYNYLDATYRFSGGIASPNNPSADADGLVHVVPGKRIPGIPEHQLKANVDYAVTSDWKVGGNVIAVGSQYYVGDDANQNARLPAYWVANLLHDVSDHQGDSVRRAGEQSVRPAVSAPSRPISSRKVSPTRSPIRRPINAP